MAINFYSHAPRGARHSTLTIDDVLAMISTHTPLAGRDTPGNRDRSTLHNFYSHAPRGARQRSKAYRNSC